jgi:hypothetical protein
MRHRLSNLEGAEIGRPPVEPIGHVGERDASIDSRGTRLQPEIEILGFV